MGTQCWGRVLFVIGVWLVREKPLQIQYVIKNQNVWTSDILYESMSSYELKTKFWAKFGPKKPRIWPYNFSQLIPLQITVV